MRTIAFLHLTLFAAFHCETARPALDLADVDPSVQEKAVRMAKGFQGAFVLVRNGRLAAAAGLGKANRETGEENTPETSFRLASVTKPITATIVLLLAEEGRIDLEKPISTYLDGFGENGRRIRVKHLLSHSSGLRDYIGSVGDVSGPEALMEVIRKGPLQFTPGTRFQYSNSNYAVLGYLVDRLTGKPYETVVEDRVFRASGMTRSGYDFPKFPGPGFAAPSGGNPHGGWEPTKKAYSAGALYASALDLARFGHALVGNKLLTAGTFHVMASKQMGNYGYGLKHYDSVVGHDGVITGFTAQLFLDAKSQGVVAVVSNGNASAPGLARKLMRLLPP